METGTGSKTGLKTLKDDERIIKLLAEGWVFHANYNPKQPGNLEEVLHTSQFTYQRPSNARELLIIDAAYNFSGNLVPGYKAIYMRDFVSVEEAIKRLQAHGRPVGSEN